MCPAGTVHNQQQCALLWACMLLGSFGTCKRRSALLAIVQALCKGEAVQGAGAGNDLHSRVMVKGEGG